MNERRKGKVIFIKWKRGYGFLRDTDDLNDIFFPAAELPKGEFESLEVGDTMTFIKTMDHLNRVKAIELQIEKENDNEKRVENKI